MKKPGGFFCDKPNTTLMFTRLLVNPTSPSIEGGLPLRPGPSGRQVTSIIALVPRCTQTLVKKAVTYRPLADPEACAQLLILTRTRGRSLLVEAFMGVIDELLQAPCGSGLAREGGDTGNIDVA